MEISKKKTILIPLILVVVLALGFGFYTLILGKSSNKVGNQAQQEQVVKQIKAEDIGLSLTPKDDKKTVVMKVTKLSGISSIEYEVSYNAEVTEEGQTNTIPRGVVNSPIEVKPGQDEVSREITLGTCSRNVCKYDKVVSDIKFVIKVNYSNGEVGSLEQSISL